MLCSQVKPGEIYAIVAHFKALRICFLIRLEILCKFFEEIAFQSAAVCGSKWAAKVLRAKRNPVAARACAENARNEMVIKCAQCIECNQMKSEWILRILSEPSRVMRIKSVAETAKKRITLSGRTHTPLLHTVNNEFSLLVPDEARSLAPFAI